MDCQFEIDILDCVIWDWFNVIVTSSLGAERGLSSIYLGGEMTAFELVIEQRVMTDEYLASYRGFVQKYDIFDLAEFDSEVDDLLSFREMVDDEAVSGVENLDFYENVVSHFLIRLIQAQSLFGDISSIGKGLYHLARLKEYMGLRRGTVSLASAEGLFDVQLRYSVIGNQIREELHRNLIIDSIPATKILFEEYSTRSSVEVAMATVNRTMSTIITSNTFVIDEDPLTVFNNYTVLIAELDPICEFLIECLDDLVDKRVTRVTIVFIVFCIIMILELFTNIWYFNITWSFIEAYGTIRGWPGFKAKLSKTNSYGTQQNSKRKKHNSNS